MRYETIIIGGGLGGLVSGIRLARAGRRVAIISAGKSALHFCSGSLEMWSGSHEELLELPAKRPLHPYNIVGLARLERYSAEIKDMFQEAGMRLVGDFNRPHYRLTPIGGLKPAWLTLEEYVTFSEKGDVAGRKVLIVGFNGYLDFYPETGKARICNFRGETIAEPEVIGEAPVMNEGINIVEVNDESDCPYVKRTAVTLRTYGETV
ncbi:MAG: FAD-binding protein [Tidjanibacter sp.]|nr:FAD-binding protein [Tidjanibacter sp.]